MQRVSRPLRPYIVPAAAQNIHDDIFTTAPMSSCRLLRYACMPPGTPKLDQTVNPTKEETVTQRDLFLSLMCVAFTHATGMRAQAEPLPERNAGIAASYPGDVGMSAAPCVIFADDFESYHQDAKALGSTWDSDYHYPRIATEAGNTFAGQRALEFTVPRAERGAEQRGDEAAHA